MAVIMYCIISNLKELIVDEGRWYSWQVAEVVAPRSLRALHLLEDEGVHLLLHLGELVLAVNVRQRHRPLGEDLQNLPALCWYSIQYVG